MATIEQLEAQSAALEEALSSGVYQVRHGDKMVTYQSTAQILAALANVKGRLRRATGAPRRRYATSTKGL